MSQVNKPTFDVPIFNPSNYGTQSKTGIEIVQPATERGIVYYSNAMLNNSSALTIDEGNNLLVGTSAPSAKLTVKGDGSDIINLRNASNTSIVSCRSAGLVVDAGALYVTPTNTNADKIIFADNSNRIGIRDNYGIGLFSGRSGQNDGGYTSFNTSSAIGYQENARITPTGLGIGTITPSNKLDVIGNASISGNVGIGITSPSSKLTVVGSSLFNSDITTTPGILEYPPIALSALSSAITTASYSNGTYNVTASTTLTVNESFRAFDKNTATHWSSSTSAYSLANGTYAGAVTTTYDGSATYAGEYIQVQLPNGIKLQTFSIQAVGVFSSSRAPQNFRIFGSNDGTTWASIGSEFVNETFSVGQTKTYTLNSNIFYTYFRMGINRRDTATTSTGAVQMVEWRLYGIQSTTTLCTVNENVGIGLSAPSAKLHIVQPDASASFRVDDQLNDTTPFIVDASGNVGIQTASPSCILDISSTTSPIRIPQLTTGSKTSLSNLSGSIVYDTGLKTISFNDGTSWNNLPSSNTLVLSQMSYPNAVTLAIPSTLSILRLDFGSGNTFTIIGSNSFALNNETPNQYSTFRYTGVTTSNLCKITFGFSAYFPTVNVPFKVYLVKGGTFSTTTVSGGTVIGARTFTSPADSTNTRFVSVSSTFLTSIASGDIFTFAIENIISTTGNLSVKDVTIVCEVML